MLIKIKRVIAKHKGAAFSETTTVREVDPSKAEEMLTARAIADEWMTAARLAHVMDAVEAAYMLVEKKEKVWAIEDTRIVIKGMLEDVGREGGFEMTKLVNKEVAQATAKLYHAWLNATLAEVED